MTGRSRRRCRRGLAASLWLAAGALAGGCGGDESPPSAAADPVVVFAAYADRAYLPALFRPFTAETGIPVIVRHGGEAALVADVIENRVQPPADLLWARDAASLFRAAEEGALRPAAGLNPAVPPGLTDPDGFWTAVSFDVAVIVRRPPEAGTDTAAARVVDYAGLAASRYAGRLCLPASAGGTGRAVLAALIAGRGIRGTERIVRQWVAELAEPVYVNEDRLVAALESGACGAAIVAAGAIAGKAAQFEVTVPDSAAVIAEGVGIARHAANPDGAQRLLEWLTSPAVQARHAAAIGAWPANPEAAVPARLPVPAEALAAARETSVTRLAAEAGEARRLAERTGYR